MGQASYTTKIGTCYRYITKDFGGWYGTVKGPDVLEATAIGADIDVRALLVSAYANAAPTLDLGTMLAEMRKTVSTVEGAAEEFRDLLERCQKAAHKRGRFGSAFKLFATTWMAGQYAYGQIVRDVQTVHDFMKKPVITQKSGKSHGSAHFVQNGVWTASIASESPTSGVFGSVSTVDEYNITASSHVLVRYSDRPNYFLDGPTTLWEMVPYSWMIDWFVNFGEWLTAMYVLRTATETVASLGYLVSVVRSSTLHDVRSLGTVYLNGTANATSEGLEVLKLRVPQPNPTYKDLRIKVNLSVDKLRSLTSVLTNFR
jgi:hypothetical protein